MAMLDMARATRGGADQIIATIDTVVVAGWAARDEAAVRHHIEELAALGVAPPSSTPVFYRVGHETITQAARLTVLGSDSSGEVEPVIVALADGLWVGVGSDHTDRRAEAHGVALSKQMCGKVVGAGFWPLSEVAPHWDALELRSWIVADGARALYQEGTLSKLRTPEDLISRFVPNGSLKAGTVMFGGTLGAIGGVRPADRFEMEVRDPVLNRVISHAYDVAVLPVVS